MQKSKGILDEIDRNLALYYSLTDEEVDFLNEVINKIINYMPNDSFIILNDINYDKSSRQ